MIDKLLPVTVIGSYSLPAWLVGVRQLHQAGRMTDAELAEAHDNAVRSCVKDQESAGIDVLTDGELRRETMVYFYSKRIAGFRFDGQLRPIGLKDENIRMPDPLVDAPVVPSREGIPMADHFAFLRAVTSPGHEGKVCCTGPHMLAKRAENRAYPCDRDLVFALADVLRAELRRVVQAGCRHIQIDEPVWIGYPQELDWAIQAYNRMVDGLDVETLTLHVCFGNYQRKQLFEGSIEALFPAILEARCDYLAFEYARLGLEQLEVFRRFPTDRGLVAGVVDVKSDRIETPQEVADRIRKVLEYFPPDKVCVAPDCGLKFTARDVAFAKLAALSAGAAIVREELTRRRSEADAAHLANAAQSLRR